MFISYLHTFVFFVIALTFGIALFCLSIFFTKLFRINNASNNLGKTTSKIKTNTNNKVANKIATTTKSTAKYSPYECGVEAFSNARMQFNVRYYLIAIFFIIFDVEMAFLFPWSVVMKNLEWSGFVAMGIFLGLLLLGLIYEWSKGALEWD